MASQFSSISLFLFFILVHVSAHQHVFEDGYTATTVIDGHKLNINSHSLLPLSGSSDLVVLDTVNSAFYTLSLPLSQESVIKRLNGNGYGYSDGDLNQAKFRSPRSFAVDHKGNIYVADRMNQVIRKISKSGVSTIATGYICSQEDEPGKNGTFSTDFDVAFVPKICALLVTDHANWLIHQINLKPEDCVRSSQPRSVFGPVLAWVLGLGLSCLIGFVSGFAIRPYITRREPSSLRFKTWMQPFSLNFKPWMLCLTNLGKQVLTLCFAIRSVVASSTLFALLKRFFWLSLSHLLLMCKMNDVEPCNARKEFVSLLDADDLGSCDMKKLQMSADPLTDLLNFDASPEVCDSTSEMFKQGDGNQGRSDVSSDRHARIDNMIQANIMGFAEASKETAPFNGPLVVSSGLVRRR